MGSGTEGQFVVGAEESEVRLAALGRIVGRRVSPRLDQARDSGSTSQWRWSSRRWLLDIRNRENRANHDECVEEGFFCGIAHILLVVIIGHNKLLEFLSFFFFFFRSLFLLIVRYPFLVCNSFQRLVAGISQSHHLYSLSSRG